MTSDGCCPLVHDRERSLQRSRLPGKHERQPLDPALSCSGRCGGTNGCCSRLCTHLNADYSCLQVGVKSYSYSLQAQFYLNWHGKRRGLNLLAPHLHEHRPRKCSWKAAVEPGCQPCLKCTSVRITMPQGILLVLWT